MMGDDPCGTAQRGGIARRALDLVTAHCSAESPRGKRFRGAGRLGFGELQSAVKP